jgi:hypothetical protein
MSDSYSVETVRIKTHGAEWFYLKLTDLAGRVRGCRWHTDASDREIAFALRACLTISTPGHRSKSKSNPVGARGFRHSNPRRVGA